MCPVLCDISLVLKRFDTEFVVINVVFYFIEFYHVSSYSSIC